MSDQKEMPIVIPTKEVVRRNLVNLTRCASGKGPLHDSDFFLIKEEQEGFPNDDYVFIYWG